MKSPFHIIISFALIFLFHFCHSQYPYPKRELADLVSSRTLAVQLLYEDSEVEISLNQAIKEAFNENYEGKCEYYFPPEIEKLKRKNRDEYTFLTQPEFLKDDIRLDITYVDGTFQYWIDGGLTNPSDLGRSEIESFEFERIQLDYYQFMLTTFQNKKEKVVTTVILPNGWLGKHDFQFVAQQINLLVSHSRDGVMRSDFVDVSQNIEYIKSSKCYFLSDYFQEEVLENFVNYYSFPNKLVFYAEYQSIIQEKPKDTTYIKILFSFQHNKYVWVIVKAENGQVLAINDIGDYKFTGTFDANNLIKPRHLKFSLNEDTQLLNNYYNK